MNWGTTKKNDTKKSSDKVVELHPSGSTSSEATGVKTKTAATKARGEDLESGMELLELEFLLSIIENTDGDDKYEVTMRKLCFKEALRRDQQNEIDSNAMKVYALNETNLYGKHIQCEAMKELSARTEQNIK